MAFTYLDDILRRGTKRYVHVHNLSMATPPFHAMQQIRERVIDDRLQSSHILLRKVRIQSSATAAVQVVVFARQHRSRRLERLQDRVVPLTPMLRGLRVDLVDAVRVVD